MPAKGRRHSPEALERIRRGSERGRERARLEREISPKEIQALRNCGAIAESMKQPAREAARTAMALVDDLGGVDRISARQLSVIQSNARLELLERVVMVKLLAHRSEKVDTELVGLVNRLANTRRALLTSLRELERHESEALDLQEYQSLVDAAQLDEPQDRAHRANGSTQDVHPVDADLRGATAEEGDKA